jgi:hypothetical protein
MKRSIFVAALAVVVGAGLLAALSSPLHLEAFHHITSGAGFATAMVASFGTVDTYANSPAILVGDGNVVSRKITLLSGENRKRGAVLGKVPGGTAISAAKAGGNTGNGTLTPDVTAPVGAGAKVGVYQVRFVVAAANNGTFRVTDPEGFNIGEVVMAAGAGAFNNDIKFAIADGAVDFIVGDGFDVTVALAAGKYKLSAVAAVDGSAVPSVILAEDCDASGGDKDTVAYFSAVVDENALTYGAGHTAATCRDPLRSVGIHLQASIT